MSSINKSYLFTSESVSEGHPDKMADQISDAILDAFLTLDPNAKVACETILADQFVLVAGEFKTQYEPDCWKAHVDAGELVPLDWAHTLAAIYRVRCNLFHGEKSAHSEMDQAIVRSAYLTLIGFFRGAGIL